MVAVRAERAGEQERETRSKRANGEGSIKLRKDGRWEARARIEGTDRYFFGKTQKEAMEKRAAFLRLHEQGVRVEGRSPKLGDYLANWLENHVKRYKSPKTYKDYSGIIRVHIAPHPIAKRPLNKLNPDHVQQFINDIAQKPKGRGGKVAKGNTARTKSQPGTTASPEVERVSARTVQYVHACLSSALGRAWKSRLIAFNPARQVDTPTVRKKQVKAMSEEREQAIFDAFIGHDYEALVPTTATLSLRQSEALGIRWKDMSFERKEVTINGKFVRLNSEWVFEPTKNETSTRTLPLPESLIEILKRHRERSVFILPESPVFCSSTGTPLDGTNVTHRFQAQLAATGLPMMKFHDLRHGGASLLLSDGADLFAVKEMLGHSQIALTANLYGHLTDKGKREIANRIDARRQRNAS